MKKLLILTLLGVLFVPMNGSAKADEVLYCQSELATGFAEENGNWREARFTRERYTVKFSSDYKSMQISDGGWKFQCHSTHHNYQRVVCNSMYVTHSDEGNRDVFIYSKSDKKFFYAKVNVYVHPFGSLSPVLRAGTCEKF